MHVTDYAGNEYIVQALSTNEGDLNGNQSVSVSIKSSKVNDLFINDIDKLWTITDLDNVEHKIIYLNKKGSGDKLNVEIRGIPLFFHKLDSDRIYDAYNEHMTAQLAFTRIFEDTGFTFVLVDSFNAIQWESFGDGETKLETFKRAINRYGAEFEIVGNIVYLKKLIGNDTNHMYRHRLNASNITQEIDAGNMWTYAKGYADYGDGEGGEDWQDANLTSEYTSPLASILGVLHAPPIKNGNIKDKSTLDQQLKTLVDESLKISVTADIHDLQKQGYPIAQSQLGDKVFLIDERIGLDDEVRVVNKSITRDWEGRVLDLNLTFGTESITKRHISNINTAIKDINAVLSGTKKIPFSAYDEAVINATNALQRMQSQLEITSNGSLLAVDKDNPNNVVILNAAGLGVSTDGGSTFGQAVTGNGINASYIATGTLDATNVLIRGGDALNYTLIQGSFFESRGRFTRTWRGETKTHDIKMRFENGYLRARNDSEGHSLYYSDFGISTFADGSGDGSGARSSGTIEFFSRRFSDTYNGLTLYSSGVMGVDADTFRTNSKLATAIETEEGLVYIRPTKNKRSYDQSFVYSTSNSNGDGYFSYGQVEGVNQIGAGFRFAHSGTPRISVVDSLYATGGDTTIESGIGEFNTVKRRAGNDYLNLQHADVLKVGSDDAGDRVASLAILNRAYSSGPQVTITDVGTLGVINSSKKYKISIEPQSENQLEHSSKILDLNIMSWFDKTESEILAKECSLNKRISDDDFTIDRHVGLIAEDVNDVGLSEFVIKRDGEIQGIMYERLWIHLIPVIKNMKSKITELENRLNEKTN